MADATEPELVRSPAAVTVVDRNSRLSTRSSDLLFQNLEKANLVLTVFLSNGIVVHKASFLRIRIR